MQQYADPEAARWYLVWTAPEFWATLAALAAAFVTCLALHLALGRRLRLPRGGWLSMLTLGCYAFAGGILGPWLGLGGQTGCRIDFDLPLLPVGCLLLFVVWRSHWDLGLRWNMAVQVMCWTLFSLWLAALAAGAAWSAVLYAAGC
jgi:hypothetical protein